MDWRCFLGDGFIKTLLTVRGVGRGIDSKRGLETLPNYPTKSVVKFITVQPLTAIFNHEGSKTAESDIGNENLHGTIRNLYMQYKLIVT